MVSQHAVDRVALLSLHSSPLASPGNADVGGMNLYVRQLADGLSTLGVQVDIFTRKSDSRIPEVVPLPSGVRVVHLPAGPAREVPKHLLPLHVPGMVASFRRFAQRESMQYDVLHSHYWLSGLAAFRCRDDHRVPVVHMFHTLSRIKEFHFGHSDPADSVLRVDGERCVLNGADAIVGATMAEQDLLVKLYGRTPASYRVVPPGVDVDLFSPRDKVASRKKLGIEAEKVALFVGRLERIKGLDILLRSVSRIQEQRHGRLRLIVVGGHGKGKKCAGDYERLASDLGLEAVVDFRGSVPHAELPLYYSAADVCAVPSAYESFGMSAVESMACQTPVVAFRVGGLAETVKDGRTGFLAEPGNEEDFTSKLRLALDSQTLDRIGHQARMMVLRYDWRSVASRTLDLYEELIEAQWYERSRVSGGQQSAWPSTQQA